MEKKLEFLIGAGTSRLETRGLKLEVKSKT